MSAVGGAFSAIGQYQQGKQQKEAEEVNAVAFERQKQLEQYRNQALQEQMARRAKTLRSKQRALYGKGGAGYAGSALLVEQDSLSEGVYDMMLQDYNSKMEQDYLQRKANYHRDIGEAYASAGKSKMFNTILGTVTNIAFTGLTAGMAGVFGGGASKATSIGTKASLGGSQKIGGQFLNQNNYSSNFRARMFAGGGQI